MKPKPDTKTSSTAYLREIAIADTAGTGVILTRTREPARVTEEIMRFVFSRPEDDPVFQLWDCVSGWRKVTKVAPGSATPAPPVGDGLNELTAALAKINDHPTEQQPWPVGIYVMQYPHWTWGDPQVTQTLKSYAAKFGFTGHRLILLVPDGTTLAPELEDDIPIIDFSLPTKTELQEIAHMTIEGALTGTDKFPFNDECMEKLASAAQGMTAAEAERAIACAIVVGDQNSGAFTKGKFADFLKVVMDAKTEVVKRSEVLEIVESLPMSEVGGNDLLKAWLQRRQTAFSPEAKAFGLRTPKGLLTVGPPGGGKSLIAKSIASMFGLPLVKFNFDRCFGSLVGESESRVRRALSQAQAMAPIVLWLDEVDSAGLSANSSSNDSGVNDRVMASLLTFMNDCTEPVVWVMTANRPWKINPALLRAGRLDGTFYVSLPDAAERQQILGIHLAKRGHLLKEFKTGVAASVEAMAGFSGAEIELAVEETLLEAFAEDKPLTDALLLEQVAQIKPTSLSSPEDFARMVEWGEKNAKPASSKGAKKATPAGPKSPPATKRVIARPAPIVRNR